MKIMNKVAVVLIVVIVVAAVFFIMSSMCVKNKTLSVSCLIRKMNCTIGVEGDVPTHRKLSSLCTCMFRLCSTELKPCPLHPEANENTTIGRIMRNFIDAKRIQYITIENSMDLIQNLRIKILLPMVMYMRRHDDDFFHFVSLLPISRLNGMRATAFTNLLIIDVTMCRRRCLNCFNVNKLIGRDVVVEFGYMLIMNCNRKRRPQEYIEILANGNFCFHIGRMLHDADTVAGRLSINTN